MEGRQLVVSAEALVRIFVFLLYLPVVLVSYRWLIPRLSSSAKVLSSGMLVAQVMVIVLALQVQSSSQFGRWLWDLHEEWNIPATLASVQLAVVGGVALLTSWACPEATDFSVFLPSPYRSGFPVSRAGRIPCSSRIHSALAYSLYCTRRGGCAGDGCCGVAIAAKLLDMAFLSVNRPWNECVRCDGIQFAAGYLWQFGIFAIRRMP